jgi:CheY-like chemotaxis protein
MRILILDDDPTRGMAFRRVLIGHLVTVVTTAPEAIQRLAAEDWDATSLDHDLGDEQMVDSGPGTGWEVARWLAENPTRIPKAVVLHSFNPPGRARMRDLLPDSVLAPGWWMTGKWPLEADVG